MPSSPAADPVRFADIQPDPPDLDALALRTDELVRALNGATALEPCLALLREWDGVRRALVTHDELTDLRFNQDTRDPARQAEREAWDAASPRWTELEVRVQRVLLAHPLRAELERELGAQAFALWESGTLAFDPTIKPELERENQLAAQYVALRASAELEVQGETVTLATIPRFRTHAERAIRHEAESALWGWFEDQGDELDRIFDELVDVRAAVAQKLGARDFVEVGYRRMCRVDYDREDVERFRAEVVREVVPLCEELAQRQGERLGVERLMAWDEPVHDPRGNPRPRGDARWQVDQARAMFAEMSPGPDGLGAFFARMDDGGFLDLESRKGKGGGGFCCSFPTHGMPFVFANFNGTQGDVEVLTHEVGHAFQNYSSLALSPVDYHWPTNEGAEVHSMSLELLTWPHMERFFGDDATRFRSTHLSDSLFFLPYGTAVDHFQHLVYERPEATPAERHGMWREMEATYLPWRDWGDLEYPAKGGRWQHQSHVYESPFYYIDYVLALTCALQLWEHSERDPAAALAEYLALCRRGGALPFQALVLSAGLTSPFESGCLAGVAQRARRFLAAD